MQGVKVLACTIAGDLLFKGSLENGIAEGLFTPDWKLPPDAAEKMRMTGAVQIH